MSYDHAAHDLAFITGASKGQCELRQELCSEIFQHSSVTLGSLSYISQLSPAEELLAQPKTAALFNAFPDLREN